MFGLDGNFSLSQSLFNTDPGALKPVKLPGGQSPLSLTPNTAGTDPALANQFIPQLGNTQSKPKGILGRAGDFLRSERGKALFASLGEIGAAIAPPNSFQQRLGTVGASLNNSDILANALANSSGGIDIGALLANALRDPSHPQQPAQ